MAKPRGGCTDRIPSQCYFLAGFGLWRESGCPPRTGCSCPQEGHACAKGLWRHRVIPPVEEVLHCVVNLLLTKKSLDPFHIFTGTSMQDASGVGASVSSVERRPLFASEAHRAVPRLLCHSAEITRSSALPLSRSRSRQTPSPSGEKLPEQGVRVAPAKSR